MHSKNRYICILLIAFMLTSFLSFSEAFADGIDERSWQESFDNQYTSDSRDSAAALVPPSPVTGPYCYGSAFLYFNVTDSYIDSQHRYVRIKFWYYNETTASINIQYRSTNNGEAGYKVKSVPRTNKLEWTQAEIYLDDIKFDNELTNNRTFKYDFRITSTSKFCIGLVEVERIEHDNGIKWYSYDKDLLEEKTAASTVTDAVTDDVVSKMINAGSTLGYSVKAGGITQEDKYVKVSFYYYDNGTQPLELNYQGISGVKTLNIIRTDTSEWKKKDFYLKDCKFTNSLSLAGITCSVCIYASGGQPAYIGKIEISKFLPDIRGIVAVDETKLLLIEEENLRFTEINDVQCAELEPQERLLLATNDGYIDPQENNFLTVKIWYLDVGNGSISFQYSAVGDIKPVLTIDKQNSGQWLEKEFSIDDAYLAPNDELDGASMVIFGNGATAFIGKIDIIKPEYKISDLKFTLNGESALSLNGGKMLKTEMTVKKVYGEEDDVLLVLALYDSKGRMAAVDVDTYSFTNGIEQVLSCEIQLPNNVSGYSAEAFIWRGMNLFESTMELLSVIYSISE